MSAHRGVLPLLLIVACIAATVPGAPPPTYRGIPVVDLSGTYPSPYPGAALPVGDGKFSSEPRAGWVYTCDRYSQQMRSGPAVGAQRRGNWFSADGRWYEPQRKVHVSGQHVWPGWSVMDETATTRMIVSNNLPSDHSTGTFPVNPGSAAAAYDRNPHHIRQQRITYLLSRTPRFGAPRCVGNIVGVMTNGVVLFNALDARGRDAAAWEVQDNCDGHPEANGAYHYHSASACSPISPVTTVVGWALDGYPITGDRIAATGARLTSRDLDTCHGIVGPVVVDGRTVTTYHYVLTKDFPHTVACFRGEPTRVGGLRPPPTPPGLPQNPRASGPVRIVRIGEIRHNHAPGAPEHEHNR